MATTRIMSIHAKAGKSIGAALGFATDYIENPNKTDDGKYISAYECDPETVTEEFVFLRQMYDRNHSFSFGKSDVIAYTDAAVNYITSQLMKRSCEGVVLFIGDSVDEKALPLSKQFTKLVTGRHSCVTVHPAILELNSKKVYFLGNDISRAQKMVVHYVMNCDFPIKEQYIGKEKLAFQREFDNEI